MKRLKGQMVEPASLASQTVAAYSDILDGALLSYQHPTCQRSLYYNVSRQIKLSRYGFAHNRHLWRFGCVSHCALL